MTNLRKWNTVVRQLRALLEILPSPQERDALVQGIREVVDVLSNLSSSLTHLPTSIEAAKAKEALDTLENITNRNPLFRVTPPKVKRARIPSLSQLPRNTLDDSALKDEVKRRIDSLSQMPEAQLRTELQQYSSYELRSILQELGRRTPKKITIKEMMEQIAVAIINRRTYEGLRGKGN